MKKIVFASLIFAQFAFALPMLTQKFQGLQNNNGSRDIDKKGRSIICDIFYPPGVREGELTTVKVECGKHIDSSILEVKFYKNNQFHHSQTKPPYHLTTGDAPPFDIQVIATELRTDGRTPPSVANVSIAQLDHDTSLTCTLRGASADSTLVASFAELEAAELSSGIIQFQSFSSDSKELFVEANKATASGTLRFGEDSETASYQLSFIENGEIDSLSATTNKYTLECDRIGGSSAETSNEATVLSEEEQNTLSLETLFE